MAIIIPSKKIYDISNSVVNKNVISAVEYQVVKHKKSQKKQAIYNNNTSTKWRGTFTDIVTSSSSPKLVSTSTFPVRETRSSIISGTEYCAIAYFSPMYIGYNIHIDTQITNQHYIDVSDLENNPISLEFRFDVEKRIRNAETRITYNGSAYDWNVYITEDYETNAETQIPPPQIVSNPTIPLEGSVIAKSGGAVPMVGFTLPWKYNKPTNTEYEAILDLGQTISLNPTFDTNEKGEVTGLNIKVQVLCGAILIEGSGAGTSVYSFGTTVTEYRPNSASIIINGTTYEIVTEQETTVLQSGNVKGEKVSVTGNGLVQNKDYAKSQAIDILYDYENGKETAKVRCSIGDYYDNENGLAITPKTDSKMTFEIGDKVVPMVRNSRGGDNALSYHSNGTAKVFDVVGEKYTYDGAVWQELTLRETAEGIYYVDSPPYLTFSSSEEFTLETQGRTHHWNGIIEYSTDLTNWEVWNGETIIPSHRGKLYLRGSGNITITNGGSNSAFKLTGANIDCKGNIETLLDYQTVKRGEHPKMYTRCFYALFLRNDALIGVPSLPSTNLAYGCYDMMFRECINLTELPNLPAKNLPSYCYSSMFLDCSSIKISTTKSNEYNREYRIPIVGDATVDETSLRAMFTLTGGEFKGTPDANTTYYTSNKIV